MSEVIYIEKCGYLNALGLLLRTHFGKQLVMGSKTLLKSPNPHFYANVSLITHKLSCVSCLLVGCEILGPLFNTLRAHQIYASHN